MVKLPRCLAIRANTDERWNKGFPRSCRRPATCCQATTIVGISPYSAWSILTGFFRNVDPQRFKSLSAQAIFCIRRQVVKQILLAAGDLPFVFFVFVFVLAHAVLRHDVDFISPVRSEI